MLELKAIENHIKNQDKIIEELKDIIQKQKQEIAQENAKKAKKAGNTETEITNLLSFQKKHAYA